MKHLCLVPLRFALILVPLAGLTACSSTTGTVSHEPTAYFKILNAAQGDMVSIDGGTMLQLNSGNDNQPIFAAPGKHTIQIMRAGAAVLSREVLVSDLQTLEIRIP